MRAAIPSDAPSAPDDARSLKILWTCPYLPWPTIGGNRLRVFHLMRELAARGHRITFVVQSDQYLGRRATATVRAIVDRLIILPRRRRLSPLTLAAAALAPYPVDVSVRGYSRAARSAMRELLAERWDAVQIEHSYFLQPFLAELRGLQQPFVLTEHNVESTLVRLNDYHPRVPRAALPYLQRFDTWRYRRWERHALSLPERLIAVTEPDAEQMRAITGRSVEVVPNGADVSAYAAVRPDRDGKRLMFIGNYGYRPNQDAVEWLMRDIMPRIWQRLPAARIIVCGSGMPGSWRRCWPDERIEFRGFVDDIAAVQRDCAAFICPLLSGGGSKLKVLEAMAGSLPVITTTQGASGLDARPGRDYLPGESAAELADAAVDLLLDRRLNEAIGAAGRSYVTATHGWAVVAEQLLQIYRELTVRHPVPPALPAMSGIKSTT
jgi:glycosyltransferase involved in cell wall biosynthesis